MYQIDGANTYTGDAMKKYMAFKSRMGAVEMQFCAYITDEYDNVYQHSGWTECAEAVEAWADERRDMVESF